VDQELKEAIEAIEAIDEKAMERTGRTFMHIRFGSSGYFQVLCLDEVCFDSEDDYKDENDRYLDNDGADGEVFFSTIRELIGWRMGRLLLDLAATAGDENEGEDGP